MAERIVLHIGAPKTGTTYLQAMLFGNREALSAQGVLVPGPDRIMHGRAATAVRQDFRGRHVEQWQRLVDETRSWPGTVLVSNEWFAMASADQAAAALEQLDADHTHLVFTARAFERQVPAAWQETLKLGRSGSLEEFCASLEEEQGRWRWGVLDPASALDRWRGDLPATNVHVVTVPGRGADPLLLWRRFLLACDIADAEWDIDVTSARESLSAESAALLRRLGPLLLAAIDADNQPWTEPFRWIQRYLSHELLAPHKGSPIGMRPEQAEQLRRRSRATEQALAAAGYHVVGDLAELTTQEPPPGARHPDDVDDAELLMLALPLVADLLRDLRRSSQGSTGDGTATG